MTRDDRLDLLRRYVNPMLQESIEHAELFATTAQTLLASRVPISKELAIAFELLAESLMQHAQRLRALTKELADAT